MKNNATVGMSHARLVVKRFETRQFKIPNVNSWFIYRFFSSIPIEFVPFSGRICGLVREVVSSIRGSVNFYSFFILFTYLAHHKFSKSKKFF